jgi:SAM-dependent methyltransferase
VTHQSTFLDPVAAYDRLAPFFSQISAAKRNYLISIENLIAARITHGSDSLLDVGAGNGARSARIARLAGLTDLVLLEPSAEMVKGAELPAAEIWPIRMEDLDATDFENNRSRGNRRFDVIICLWNTLGHVRGFEIRARALKQLGGMLAPRGKLFLDLNHRYNTRAYGVFMTALRFLKDRLFPEPTDGDVEVTWPVGDGECTAYGHVFTDREVRHLVSSAGLVIEERVVVDYESGDVRRFAHQGNLLCVLRRRNSKSEDISLSSTVN